MKISFCTYPQMTQLSRSYSLLILSVTASIKYNFLSFSWSFHCQDLLICPVRMFFRIVSNLVWLYEPAGVWLATASTVEGPLGEGTMTSSAGILDHLSTALLVLSNYGLTHVHVLCLFLQRNYH